MKNIYYILTIVFAVILNGEEKYNNSILIMFGTLIHQMLDKQKFGFKIGQIIQDYSLNRLKILHQ